jgi:multiple sugar transport system permease protein
MGLRGRRVKRRERVLTITRFTVAALLATIYLLPLFWMVSTSVKPPTEIIQKPPVLITTSPQIDSYRQVLGLPTDRQALYISTLGYLKNSLVIGVATTALTLLLGIPAAYALARFRLRAARLIILAILVAQMLPSVLLVIPLFVVIKTVGLYGSQLAVIIADTALALPFGIIILRTTFRQVPRELEEAAWVDGASRLVTLRRIVLPLMRPGIVAVAVFSFLTAWGEFVFALSFLPDVANQPISLGVFQFVGMYKTQWDSMMAFATLVAIPAVIAILLLKGQFVSGLTAGSVKA